MDPAIQEFVQKVAHNAYWAQFAQLGYALYWVAFVAGAALMLGGVLLPRIGEQPVLQSDAGKWRRLSEHRGRIMVTGAMLLLLLCAISQQTGIDQNRGFIADQEKRYEKEIKRLAKRKDKEEILRSEYMYMPEGDSLTVMTANNPSLAADYVWLTSLQYVSNSFRRGQKFDMLSRFYATMQELDPRWVESAVNAGKVLSALEPDRFKVEQFYMHAVTNNPDSLKLLYEAGRLFVVPPMDPSQQKKYSERAVGWFQRMREKMAKEPASPSRDAAMHEVEDLIARLGLEAGYYKSAAELLYRHATDERNPEAMRSIAAEDWLTARSLSITEELNDLAEAYKKEHDRFPATLEVILDALPEHGRDHRRDAFGFPIEYDPNRGEAFSRGVNAKRSIQAASVVNDLIAAFKNDRQRLPVDLRELQDFVSTSFNTFNPPSNVMVDALGANLDVLNGPIGPWEYDADKGCIILPPYCNAKSLFKNAERLWKK